MVKPLSCKCSSWPSHSALDHGVEIERFLVELLLLPLEAREVEHVVDQPREPLGFDHDDAQILRVFRGALAAAILHQFGKHADGSERRLQLVRDIGNEVGLLLRERELAARVGHDEPAAAGDDRQRGGDEEDDGAAQERARIRGVAPAAAR